MPDRTPLLEIIETMPEEAFGYVLYGALRGIPDGLGGFRPESRDALVAFQQAADAYMAAAKADA